MGTRADLWVGRGKKAEWLGSIAWDGYPDGNPEPLAKAKTEAEFRNIAADIINGERGGGTTPDEGWPWPWEDSSGTDFAYAWDDGVWVCCFGWGWRSMADCLAVDETETDLDELWAPHRRTAVFPTMDTARFKRPGSRGSGAMVFKIVEDADGDPRVSVASEGVVEIGPKPRGGGGNV